MPFIKATKLQAKARLAISGPSGSGKTYTSLAIATALCDEGKRVALIDTERGSASKYSDLFDFDTLELDSYHPQKYIDAIKDAEAGGYGVLVVDSLSHGWNGRGGTLELVDQAAARSKSSNTFGAWREVTPIQNALVDAIVSAKLHVIATMRSKQAYVQESANGKTTIRKVGMEPVQRDGMEFEFDIFGEMDQENNLIITKTRCPDLNRAIFNKPGEDLAFVITKWLGDGAPPPPIETQISQAQREAVPALPTYEQVAKALQTASSPKALVDIWTANLDAMKGFSVAQKQALNGLKADRSATLKNLQNQIDEIPF